jgi:hypothetical protein
MASRHLPELSKAPIVLVAIVLATASATAAVFYVPLVIVQCTGSEGGEPSSSLLCDFGFVYAVAWLLAAIGVVSPLVGAVLAIRRDRSAPLALTGVVSALAAGVGLTLIQAL